MSVRLKRLIPIEKGHCIHIEQKIFYNIQLLLEELVDLNTPKEPPKPEEDNCPKCGKVHKNIGERLNCAKKHKKKG